MKTLASRFVGLCLLLSTICSVAGIVLFLSYLSARLLALSFATSTLHDLVVGIFVAIGGSQAFQIIAALGLIVVWFSTRSVPRSRREIILLGLSLIPFFSIVLTVLVIGAYIRTHIKKLSEEEKKELRDTGLDG